jgi:hypothetical protein
MFELDNLEKEVVQTGDHLLLAHKRFEQALTNLTAYLRTSPDAETIRYRERRMGAEVTKIAIELQQSQRPVESLTLEELQEFFQRCIAKVAD